ncbi:hypothetical protein [Rossellomorea marisflavi]|uniref:hypothetical protein n=1 Tax=Rossellomorea marisflavi TaxID=189381 RepID=UPI00345DE6CD
MNNSNCSSKIHSAVQRRPTDSRGNSGQGETLQAQLKRLTVHPAGKRTAAAERNAPSPLNLIQRWIVRQRSLILFHTVQCSGGHPTPMGIAGRVRPCRLAEAAHRTPHGKRVAAAKRNAPFLIYT